MKEIYISLKTPNYNFRFLSKNLRKVSLMSILSLAVHDYLIFLYFVRDYPRACRLNIFLLGRRAAFNSGIFFVRAVDGRDVFMVNSLYGYRMKIRKV